MKGKLPAMIICVGAFAALFVLAGVFYLERIANLDMAFQTFLILKSGSIEIQSGRFGAAATQVWPWLFQKLGFPLQAVLLAYSLGHVLWPTLLAWFSWHIGQWRWSLAIVLVATLMTTHTFYWLSEMPQGLAFLCAIFAWMHSKAALSEIRWWQWPLWLAALVSAFYFHPLVMYALAFLSIYFSFEEQRPKSWRVLHFFALAVFGVLAFLKYKVFKLDWYDAQAFKRQEAFSILWPNWFDIPSNWKFLEWSQADYWLLWVVMGVCVVYFLRQADWKRASWLAACSLGFVVMVNVPYHEGLGQQFYMENLYLPLAVFVAIPLVFNILRTDDAENSLNLNGTVLLAVFCAANLFRIGVAHKSWTKKLQWEQQFLQETSTRSQRKILLGENQVPAETLKMTWGTPYEFLLLSSLPHPDSARSILVTDSPQRYDSLLARPRLFLGIFKNYPYEELPAYYFNLSDTSAYVRW